MSIYDNRDTPAYRGLHTEPSYAKNPLILGWWTPSHDELLRAQIQQEQWAWYWGITDQIVDITPPEVIETWKATDPLCSNYAWYNVVMYFAASRAEQLGFTETIRPPQSKTCPLCNHTFVENSLPQPLVKRLGIDQLDFCAPCLKDTVLQQTGNSSLPREQVLTYLRDLTEVLQRVPSQGFGEGMDDLRDLSTQERLALLRLLQRKPSVRRVKDLFGSWFEALVKAGVLEDDARRMTRGTQCLAKDGHVCFSLGEKTVDDTLYALRVPHQKEVPYPEGNLRADFAAEGVFVEYFGLAGDADYDSKTQLKQSICKKHRIRLVSIYPADLASPTKLNSKLKKGLALKETRWHALDGQVSSKRKGR
jgi:hypothetical protein